MVGGLTYNARPCLRPKPIEGPRWGAGEPVTSPMLDLQTLEHCQADDEALRCELLFKERPTVARAKRPMLPTACAGNSVTQISNVVEPVGCIAEAATLLERRPQSSRAMASYELRHGCNG